MSLANLFRSSEFASAILWMTVAALFHTCSCCGFLAYGFLALGTYQLFDVMVSKKIKGQMLKI
jgi:hypothetical protein